MKYHIHKILVIVVADNDIAIVPIFLLIFPWKSLMSGNFYQIKGYGLATTGTQYKHFYNTTLQKHTNFMQGWAEMG